MAFLPVCEPTLLGNELKYITDAVESGWISSSGEYVSKFEEMFATYCGTKHAIAVCNGTVALHLALIALGVGPGDEVIVPNFTMISSSFSVCYTGAMPVFADADFLTWNISVEDVLAKITPRTKAIMPVHIFGNVCDMKQLKVIADDHGIALIEDAAEAHGAEFAEKRAGSLGDIAAFSFFANKNITTGEGGMVVTNNDSLARTCRYHKNICFSLAGARDYLHGAIGFNYRMSNLHAAIGVAQMERAAEYTDMRIQNGMLYKSLLSEIKGLYLQDELSGTKNVFWMNGVVIDPVEFGHSRDELVAFLKKRNIDSRLFFKGMNRQPALKKYGCDCSGAYPASSWLADNGLYLPSASSLSADQITRVCTEIYEFSRT